MTDTAEQPPVGTIEIEGHAYSFEQETSVSRPRGRSLGVKSGKVLTAFVHDLFAENERRAARFLQRGRKTDLPLTDFTLCKLIATEFADYPDIVERVATEKGEDGSLQYADSARKVSGASYLATWRNSYNRNDLCRGVQSPEPEEDGTRLLSVPWNSKGQPLSARGKVMDRTYFRRDAEKYDLDDPRWDPVEEPTKKSVKKAATRKKAAPKKRATKATKKAAKKAAG